MTESRNLDQQRINRTKLLDILRDHFSESDLRDLCFKLGVDYDALPGRGTGDKTRELVEYFRRRGQLPRLIDVCRQLRPNAPWQDVFLTAEEALLVPPSIAEVVDQDGQAITVGETESPIVEGEPSGTIIALALGWFFLGFFLIGALVFYFAQDINCVLRYRTPESLVTILIALLSAIVIYFSDFTPLNVRRVLKCISGGAVCALFLYILWVLLSLPPLEAQCFPPPPHTPTPTVAPAHTLSPTAATPADTSIPSEVPSVVPEETESPTSTTPPPTPSPVPTTATPAFTPTLTPTRSPVDIWTPTPPAYLPPVLGDISIVHCNVTFRWSWSGTLNEDEWFAVRVGVDTPKSVRWVKEDQYTHTLGGPGEYSWEIAVCRGDPINYECHEQLTVSERGTFRIVGDCPPVRP